MLKFFLVLTPAGQSVAAIRVDNWQERDGERWSTFLCEDGQYRYLPESRTTALYVEPVESEMKLEMSKSDLAGLLLGK